LEAGVEISHQTLGHYERDRTAPQIDDFLSICDVFDGSPLWVLIGLGPRRWTDLPEWLAHPVRERLLSIAGDYGMIAEAPAPYSSPQKERPVGFRVSEGEYQAINLVAGIRDQSVADLLRDRVDLAGVVDEAVRMRDLARAEHQALLDEHERLGRAREAETSGTVR